MSIKFLLLLNQQSKIRLIKWYVPFSHKDKSKIIKDVSYLVIHREENLCNILEYNDVKVVYRKYASLYFIMGISTSENELMALATMQRYVETLDRYFGTVSELDLILNYDKAYYILDEIVMCGEPYELNKEEVFKHLHNQDAIEAAERLGSKLFPSF